MHFIIVVEQQLGLCLVSMGTLLLLGKDKPLTNELIPPSKGLLFSSWPGEGRPSQQSHTARGQKHAPRVREQQRQKLHMQIHALLFCLNICISDLNL